MTVLAWLAMILFSIKVFWNLGVPYELLRRRLVEAENSATGISLAPAIELSLLAPAIAFSALSRGESWINEGSAPLVGARLISGRRRDPREGSHRRRWGRP